MNDHFDLDDDCFEASFRDSSLDPALFNHEAHLRLAWIHINKYGVEQAVRNICPQIQSFDRKYGDGSKYHETVTVAAIRAVNHFNEKSLSTNFSDFYPG